MKSMRERLLASSMICGVAMALAAPAFAQVEAEPAAPVTTVGPTEVEELVITGSRLRLPDYTQSAPVVSIGQEAIQRSGTTNLTDFLKEVPALTGSFNSQDGADVEFGGVVGLNLLDLRNLGTQRTLLLVNGRRHVPTDGGTGAVDTNTIPISLIERIEVLTGGASATYGADAVSGVVNFILKDDFEGLEGRVQHGWTDAGGGSEDFVSIVAGHNFNEGRGNFTVAFEASRVDSIDRDERDYSRLGNRKIYSYNPADLGDDPDILDFVVIGNVRYPDTSPYGSVYTDLDFSDDIFGIDWQGDGMPWVTGQPTDGFFVIGGSGSLTDEFEDQLMPGLDRDLFHTTFRYDLTPQHRFFFEGKVVNTRTAFTTQPTYDFGYGDLTFSGLYVPLDNPFIPANILQDAQTTPGGTLAEDIIGLPGVLVLRDNIDMGYTGYDIDRTTYRGVVGFEGELTDSIDYEVSYVYGRTDEENVYTNARINERWLAGIDAVEDPLTGAPVCRSNLDPSAIPFDAEPTTWGSTFTPGPNSGCVPIDIFGRDVSPEARAWVNTDLERNSKITQQVFTAFIQGDTGPVFSLPAGPISYGVGVEYRKEGYSFRASDLELLAADQEEENSANGVDLEYDVTWLGQTLNSDGEYDVKEAFAEVSIPLLRDVPFARALTVDGSYRYSEYSMDTITRTWKVGGLWKITDDVMLRGATARAVRAPNIADLFTPLSQTSALLDDPCDKDNVNAGTSFRYDNCETALGAIGLDPDTFDNNNTGSVEGRSGGNPDLNPEIADTFTVGIVFTPTFFDGLTMSVDYYDIELQDAIQLFTAQTIVDKCYDLPQPNDFCPLISRETASGPDQGYIDNFRRFALNVASYKTSGYDFTIRYRLDPENFGIEKKIGNFQFDLVGNKLEELTFVELADADPDEDLGDPDAPEWQLVFDATWRYDAFSINYGYSWYSKTLAFGVDEPNRFVTDPDYVDDRYYDERSVHDIQFRYDTDASSYFFGINNFTNQEPEFGFVDVPYVTHQGRFMYIGFRAKLDSLGSAWPF